MPRLRYLWSRSPVMTVEGFRSLKEHQEEPDETVAAKVGIIEDDTSTIVNSVARDIMLKLPGVNQSNCYAFVRQLPDLAAVVNASESVLQQILGPSGGTQLYRFFHHQFQTAD
eukprot:c13961_g1_i1.p1 GENE.c13961_g1_i1~~c13961_g1_i1.p1  ORF type:complete len:113 (-),score=30.31 c13961_g1_i1:8-346(-)